MRLSSVAGLALAVAVAGAAIGEGQTTGRQQTPPLAPDSLSGRDTFGQYCAPCHGNAGRGDGPVAPALRTRPSDLTMLAVRNGGVFPGSSVASFVTGAGRNIQAHGTTDMPVWGPTFRALDTSDARVKVRIENVVEYIASIQMK
jgi:mono/diheme cytochrome c family protein